MSKTQNQKTYSSAGIVDYYRNLNALQPAEQMILDRLSLRLSEIRMLDIGTGAGRTTQYFSDRTAEYIGIDSSSEMIAACQKRFPQNHLKNPKVSFAVCDARDMSCFEDNSFDFVLFSFNGIDYVSECDRLQILHEVFRITKPKGLFFFSSHNLQGFERAFNPKFQWSLNPIATYTNLMMLGILRVLNRPLNLSQLRNLSYAIVKDESHNFCLNTYYIRPQAQIEQLVLLFSDIQVYSWKNDIELINISDRNENTDMWLYYYCTVNKS